MKSLVKSIGNISIPLFEGEYSMLPFNLETLEGLSDSFKPLAMNLLKSVSALGIGFFTLHGKKLQKGETLRRGGPHTDGSFDKNVFDWGDDGGGGWKIGENGPPITHPDHIKLYNSTQGGLILASNFASCLGWGGEFEGLPGVGGDCSHINLNSPFLLKSNKIYYGNNHFIHESLPVSEEVHRVFVRITLPYDHEY